MQLNSLIYYEHNNVTLINIGTDITVLEFIKMYNVKKYKYEGKREGI